jgi:hypothetical protein
LTIFFDHIDQKDGQRWSNVVKEGQMWSKVVNFKFLTGFPYHFPCVKVLLAEVISTRAWHALPPLSYKLHELVMAAAFEI